MSFQPCNGYVGIRLPQDIDKKNAFVLPTDDKRYIVSVKGEVVSIPKELPFCGDEAEILRNRYKDYRPKYIQHLINILNIKSLNFDTDIEIKVGDIVTFNYLSNLWGQEFMFGDTLYVRYDNIYMVNDEPINGYILVEKEEEKHHQIFYTPELKSQHYTVLKQGKPVRGYRMFPYIKDEDINLVGKVVAVRRGREVKFVDNMTESDRYVIQQKDILAYANKHTLRENKIIESVRKKLFGDDPNLN